MIAKKIEIEFDELVVDENGFQSPPIIGIFGNEHVGKTRFGITLPDPIAFLPLEVKSYETLKKDSVELNKRIIKPKDPYELIPGMRLLNAMKDDSERQQYYINHVKLIETMTYKHLENPNVRSVVIDKFTTYTQYKEYAVNGMVDKARPMTGGGMFKPRGELRQQITDFIISLSQFGKPVVLLCAEKPDYDVTDSEGKPIRRTWDCNAYPFLGSHCNITCQIESNEKWQLNSSQKDKKWKYRLNVRRCQFNPSLEGPEGNPLLEGDEISYPALMQAINPDVDVDTLI